MLDSLRLQLCKIQGRLFELSLTKNFDSEIFITLFMKSKTAGDFGLKYNRLQWAGEEYLLEEVVAELGDKLTAGAQYSKDEMFWIGYTYCYWHFLTEEDNKKIVLKAPPKKMLKSYAGLHTIDTALAIEDLIGYERFDVEKIYECPSCRTSIKLRLSDYWEFTASNERQMGHEAEYSVDCNEHCPKCGKGYRITGGIWEYPALALNDDTTKIDRESK